MYTWSKFDTSDIVYFFRKIPHFVKLQPNSGNLLVDLFWILVLACLQSSIIPSLTGGLIFIDLLTPWLTVNLIKQSLGRGAVLAAMSAAVLETHSTLPAGTYFCSYAVTLAFIANFREPLSWNHRTPWCTAIAASCVWSVLFEVIVLSVLNEGIPYFEWSIVLNYFLRLFIAIPFGFILAEQQMRLREL